MSDSTAIQKTEAQEQTFERRLASGGSLHLRTNPGGEEIELRSARGDLDLRIVLTDTGPLVTLRCAKLEVESPEVAFRCHDFAVQTTGDLRLKSEGDIHMNGAYVRLNCSPDLQVPVPMPTVEEALKALEAAQAPAHEHDHSHDHAHGHEHEPTP